MSRTRRTERLMPKPLILAALSLLLTACQTPAPIRHYTLVPPTVVGDSPAQDPAYQVIVDTVAIPAQVDTPYFVVREGRNELVPVESHRWAAPLADEVRAAIIDGLDTAVGAPTVASAAADSSLPTYRLRITLRRFDSVLGRQTLIDAGWSIESLQDPKRNASCDSQVASSVAPGFPALADGHQRALLELARRIASGLESLHAGRAASVCVAANNR